VDSYLVIHFSFRELSRDWFISCSKLHSFNMFAVLPAVVWQVVKVVWAAALFGFIVDNISPAVLSDNKKFVLI